MIFNSDNLIDRQISESFKEDDFLSERFDHFGVNVYSSPDKDFSYKIYSNGTDKGYLEQLNNPVIDYVKSKNMLDFVSVVRDTSVNGLKISFSVNNRTENNMLDILKFLNKNVPIFNANKDEIMEFSKLKHKGGDDLFFALSFVYENNINTKFRVYWSNGTRGSRGSGKYNSSYYINQLKSSNIHNFKVLAPIVDKVVSACGGKVYISGINYALSGPVSHKVYVVFPNNPYDGLISVFPKANAVLTDRLNKLKEWNSIHPEFKCDGICINIDDKNCMNLKLFYYIDGTANRLLSIDEIRNASPVLDKTRELRHHYTIKPATHPFSPKK